MKNTLIAVILISCIAVITVLSCKKSNNNNSGVSSQSLNQVFSGLRPTPQLFSVTAGRDTIVYGADSTILHFYTNSFKDVHGNAITSGTVYLSLTEIYKPSDFIANRTTTVTSNGQLLQSGGEINLVAEMNGQIVYANQYGIGFKQSAPSTLVMQLYYGAGSATDSAVNWTVSDTTKSGNNANGTTTDSVITLTGAWTDYYYFFTSSNFFGYANCDRIRDTTNAPLTTVSVILPDATFIPGGSGLANANTEVYLIIPAGKAVLGDGQYNASTFAVAMTDDGSKIPVGMNYEVVLIANKNGQYYYWESSGTVSSGMILTAVPAPDTQGDILARIAAL